MKREEIKNIVRHVFHFYEANVENYNWTDMNEACEEVLNLLEQEPALDKIRAEIMSKDGLEEALEIIDKYRSEIKWR